MDIIKSESLGGIRAAQPSELSDVQVAQRTDHAAALATLDSALADDARDDEQAWKEVKSELQRDRFSSRKLFK